MAAGRRRSRRSDTRQRGTGVRPPGSNGVDLVPQGEESTCSPSEHKQSQRNEEVRCSNHDATHTLILSANRKLSEHWATAPANCPKLRLVKELGNQNIVQIACGDQHAMALSRGGELFTWGQNTHGQLGVGNETTFILQPQLVKSIKGIPLAQIAAGGAHSAAVSLSGAVYSWGKNDFGQLGLGDTKDRHCPSYVGALEHWKTVFISCGADHTAALSKEGLVCTFGAGGAGQLGHNSTQNELTPRVVAELWGARVSQIACGRQHTLVYVPSLDKVYWFGAGEKGQLGDRPHQLIPLPINSPVDTGKSPQANTSQKVIEIIAREKQSIALCKNKDSYLNGIATLKDEDVDAWISKYSFRRWENVKKHIRLIFSSEACINGSFLEKRDKHFKTSKEFSGIDLSKVQCFYKKIIKKPDVFKEVQNQIEMLLPSLSSSPISPENFRVYLILPFLLQGEDDSSFHCLGLLAKAIMRLQTEDLQTLECLWSNLETAFFKKLVILYRKVSQNNLSQFVTKVRDHPRNIFALHLHETVTLQILQILYQVNSRTGFRVQEIKFYVPQVKEIISWCWFATPRHLFQLAMWKLTQYPCIFDIQDKNMIFSIERKALSSPFDNVPLVLVGLEEHVLIADRQHLLQDIWTYLNSAQTSNFRKILKVCFVGEEGVDQGGPSQELFSVAARSLCQPHSGAFHLLASGLVWFPTQVSSCDDDIFFHIGTLCGMALYNRHMAPFPFPRALYKKLLGLEPTLEDFKELLPDVGRRLQGILDEECDHVFESLDMDFTVIEEGGSTVELKQNGANIPVTKDNRKEFVDLYVNYVFNESIRKPFGDFKKGFLRGCPAGSWKMFLPDQLQIILQGHTKYDWKLLQKNVAYRQYGVLDQTIKNFWTVFHELPEEKKKKFLAFLTGSSRIPGYGQENFKFAIEDPKVNNPDEFYPSANTCSHILFLPRYSSKRILKEKLLYAIEHNETFFLP